MTYFIIPSLCVLLDSMYNYFECKLSYIAVTLLYSLVLTDGKLQAERIPLSLSEVGSWMNFMNAWAVNCSRKNKCYELIIKYWFLGP